MRVVQHSIALLILALAMALGATTSVANNRSSTYANASSSDNDFDFPKPAAVRKRVRFWKKIFYRYPSTTVVVHDMDDPDRIIDLIDYRSVAHANYNRRPLPRAEREKVTQKYLKRYTLAVDRFKREKERAIRHGSIERRLFNTYGKSPKTLERLLHGQVNIRAQTGLADDFLQAAGIAKTYFPYMEGVFKSYGIPTRLTRLAFVESMFNLKAKSKVGASGIWQFMPETARNYVHVNQLVDERNSPEKSTRAAAQLLLSNYMELKSWPLAITAYNHGQLGLHKAIKQLGTRDLGRIIEAYDSPTFGFASSNFYAEFVAAADTYQQLEAERRILPAPSRPQSTSLVLRNPITTEQLLAQTRLNQHTLASLNPCILDAAWTRYAKVPLPPYYEIWVPTHLASAISNVLNKSPVTRYATR